MFGVCECMLTCICVGERACARVCASAHAQVSMGVCVRGCLPVFVIESSFLQEQWHVLGPKKHHQVMHLGKIRMIVSEQMCMHACAWPEDPLTGQAKCV